jgi:hypothetical protein
MIERIKVDALRTVHPGGRIEITPIIFDADGAAECYEPATGGPPYDLGYLDYLIKLNRDWADAPPYTADTIAWMEALRAMVVDHQAGRL